MIGFPTNIWTHSLSTIHFKLKILIKKAVFFEHLLYLFIVRTKINNIKETWRFDGSFLLYFPQAKTKKLPDQMTSI